MIATHEVTKRCIKFAALPQALGSNFLCVSPPSHPNAIKMNGRLDGCLIVSCCEDSPEELIKEIVHSELPEPAQVADDTKAFPWPIETKYYTATIYLHSTSAPVSRYDDSAENIHGLIVLFDPGQKESLDSAAKWIEKCSCEVVLLVCGRCPANNEADGMSRQQVLEWCIDRGCELIETRPNEDDDEEDATGVKRIVEALHAHPWPNLEMKDSTRPGGTRERLTARGGSDGSQAELMTAQRELELFSEAMADGDDMSFEELFAKFQDMKGGSAWKTFCLKANVRYSSSRSQ